MPAGRTFSARGAGLETCNTRLHRLAGPAGTSFHDVFPEQSPRIWIFSTDIFVPEVTFVDDNNNPVETAPYTP